MVDGCQKIAKGKLVQRSEGAKYVLTIRGGRRTTLGFIHLFLLLVRLDDERHPLGLSEGIWKLDHGMINGLRTYCAVPWCRSVSVGYCNLAPFMSITAIHT